MGVPTARNVASQQQETTAALPDLSNCLIYNELVACSEELREVLVPQWLTGPRVPEELTVEERDW